jgi:DNA-binding NarL/FixJ family response regulator
MDPIRILIADDHPLFRDGLRALLESVADMQIIGEAATGDEALVQARVLQPDVILMDIKMPGLNGIEATRRILQTSPHIRILILTMFEDDESVFAAVRAGARGYLLKGAVQEETLRAIRAVASGEAIFGPTVASRLMHYFGSTRPTARSGPAQFFPELTDREYEILTLIAQRKSNAQIAAHFVLSPKTVRNHVSNILSKLQVADRAEAMHAAWTAGLGQGDSEHTPGES